MWTAKDSKSHRAMHHAPSDLFWFKWGGISLNFCTVSLNTVAGACHGTSLSFVQVDCLAQPSHIIPGKIPYVYVQCTYASRALLLTSATC
ncbi:hypothetical protein ASPBRDRAFT_296530 [Aspergillus brasiliensis CBS 101740]|uniref:Uncharacterized protein n=1 Tax=Aspergillus brasiliensis (strain CBS 101740 / IMI 381727 / IBT 21946) TaxID=767769 RepID=A0A1L9UC75_ASPBC|nr:hypothetical protein ASPBRDRAFT_296530 [Aspergillus brasiliensis CBS 101740]